MPVDKVRVTPLNDDERVLINTLSPEERKNILLKAAREKMQRSLNSTEVKGSKHSQI